MKKSVKDTSFLFLLLLLLAFLLSITANDILNTTHILRDGDTLVSSEGTFALGFFSPGNSDNRYVGIWYNKIPVFTVVWVANREIPLKNTSGVLKVIEPGLLVLFDNTGNIIWSTKASRSSQIPVAQLLDSGNLVVKDSDDDRPENYLWQSFEYPTDTYLPGMKFGWNFVTGRETNFSSWKTDENPAPGDYEFRVDPNGYPQLLIIRKGTIVQHRVGPWNGVRFSGTPNPGPDPSYRFGLFMNKNEVYFWENPISRSLISRYRLSPNGLGQRWTWVDKNQDWISYSSIPLDNCDTYKLCGAYGSCDVGNSPVCGCLSRFVPRDPEDWSKGCIRRDPLNCQKGDIFLKYSGIKMPDTRKSWFNKSMTLEECKLACLRNCSCTAYTNLDIRRGGSGCLLWFGDLIDIRRLYVEDQVIYIRMAASELDGEERRGVILIWSLSASMGIIVLLGLSWILHIRKTKKKKRKLKNGERYIELHNEELELPSFDFSTISKATNNFAIDNKLGEGGFGPVYKGILEDGQEVAVKRLSKTSEQGIDEFKNEVVCISKLQHRNLVKLLGCCIEKEKKMLVYEYMPNKSLDFILFDETKSRLLDWPKRFNIINGIARGLMYLHQDSRMRIIHRDLKASNILLDADMNPRISDFGMARSFGGDETGAKTRRIVGTYGYMSPEYVLGGAFSIKSDVYSFGVLVLEIVSGKRNWGFSHSDHHLNLLGHAWILHKEGRSLELADTSQANPHYLKEVLRSIHVGLLCVQQYPGDRPSMSTAIFMLEKEVVLPNPKRPGFFTERDLVIAESSTSTNAANSLNEVTITLLDAR
ncbi:G-type lectin S-receptor-like serine/threonine-protein kinase At4g27290 [Olea europaea var. sylvestris]|uniref:G-type lectin S-receptor-like serine/threonine-protein kinase At4g27290 n=1 Tax=Olea europaea var. sylvestris TaxID=158386 RepID=UPI000C1D042E|nr:G-type lectin S-receptor-like serine/threonine-protein kinase At4g27290 [Olea europaea var. sylvestris]